MAAAAPAPGHPDDTTNSAASVIPVLRHFSPPTSIITDDDRRYHQYLKKDFREGIFNLHDFFEWGVLGNDDFLVLQQIRFGTLRIRDEDVGVIRYILNLLASNRYFQFQIIEVELEYGDELADIRDELHRFIRANPALVKVDIYGMDMITLSVIRDNCPGVTTLDLQGAHLTPDQVGMLRTWFPYLTALNTYGLLDRDNHPTEMEGEI